MHWPLQKSFVCLLNGSSRQFVTNQLMLRLCKHSPSFLMQPNRPCFIANVVVVRQGHLGDSTCLKKYGVSPRISLFASSHHYGTQRHPRIDSDQTRRGNSVRSIRHRGVTPIPPSFSAYCVVLRSVGVSFVTWMFVTSIISGI